MNPPEGRHLSFPFRIGTDGRTVQTTSRVAHVHDEIIQLLMTNLGERVFLPEFGGDVRRLLFEPLNEATRGVTKAKITQAITTWLGHRVTLEDLSVEVDNSTIEVEVKYRLAGTEDARIMRFQRKSE